MFDTVTPVLSSLLVESRIRPAGTLLVGDPSILSEPPDPAPADGAAFTALVAPGGLVAAVRPPDPAGSAFVWVGGARGAVRRVTVAFDPDAVGAAPAFLGHVDCPSGRLVVGTPEAVASWGEDVEPAEGLAAQARAHRLDRRYCGLVVVARVPRGAHPVFGFGGPDALGGVAVDVFAHRVELRLAG